MINLMINLYKMRAALLIKIVFSFLSILVIFLPISLLAVEIDSSPKEIEPSEVDAPNQMSQKQMNDLFGDDPYLGQTSYLQSPDGFSQRENS